TAPGKSPLATSCSVDSCLGLVLLAKATSSHVSVLSLQKAIAFSISTTVVLAQGKFANATSNLGEILMSGAVIAAATGAGAPVAAGMAAIGGGLWLIGKAIEHRKTIAKVFTQPVQTAKEVANTVTKAAKNVATTVKKGISNAVDTVKGWFS